MTNPWRSRIEAFERRFGERVAVSSGDLNLSFAALARQARGVMAALCESGIAAGEPVAVLAPNGPSAVAGSYGVLASGAAEFFIDPSLGPDDIAYAVRILGIRRAVAARAEAGRLHGLGVEVLAIEDLAEAGSAPHPAHRPDAWGRIVLTSGTTGRPKAIVHSQARRWLAHLMLRAHMPFLPGPADRILLMTPYAHGAGMLAAAYLDSGASVELVPGVDAAHAEAVLRQGRANAVFAPPTALSRLVEDFAPGAVDGVRCVFCGTATLRPGLYRRAAALFGPVVRVTYGKSEIFNPITVMEPAETDAYYREADAHEGVCLGAAASGVEVVIRDDDGRPCAPGEHGEIHLRAPHMLIGHVDEAGFHALATDAHHATGDLGYLDDGDRLFLTGRAHDVIKTGGYKIYPEEIERRLPGEMTVVGIPSRRWGEVLVAVAEEERVPAGWQEAAEAAVAGLARYKCPRAYLSLPALPRNAQGKVPRAKVRDLLLEHYTLIDGRYPRFAPR